MAIQDTDLLLINRGGASFYVKQEDLIDKVEDADLALVNRLGVSYNLTGANLKSGTFDDDDLFLVNRLGQSYRCLGSQIKTGLGPPSLESAEWSFQEKSGDVSLFKLTVVFEDRPINTTIPTSFHFDLTTQSSTNLGALQELTNVQFAQKWLRTTQGPTIVADPSITNFENNGQSAFIYIKIPRTIDINNGLPYLSSDLFASATWRSFVNISQNNQMSVFGKLAQGFISESSMFP